MEAEDGTAGIQPPCIPTVSPAQHSNISYIVKAFILEAISVIFRSFENKSVTHMSLLALSTASIQRGWSELGARGSSFPTKAGGCFTCPHTGWKHFAQLFSSAAGCAGALGHQPYQGCASSSASRWLFQSDRVTPLLLAVLQREQGPPPFLKYQNPPPPSSAWELQAMGKAARLSMSYSLPRRKGRLLLDRWMFLVQNTISHALTFTWQWFLPN